MSNPAPSPRVPSWTERAAPLCGAWWVLVALNLAFGLLVPHAVLRDELQPAMTRMALTATELAAAAAALSLGLAVPVPRPGRWRRVVRTSLGALLFMGYAASWVLFTATGQFLDVEGLSFAARNLEVVLSFAWVLHPVLLTALPPLLLSAGAALALTLPRLAALPAPPRASFVRVTLSLAGLCLLLALIGEIARRTMDRPVFDAMRGTYHPFDRLYAERRSRRTGPLTRIGANALRPGLRAPAAAPVLVDRPAQTPIKAWAAAVDPSHRTGWNVVLVVVDSLRADHLAAYGEQRRLMPALDAIAAEGQVFLDSYAQASHTHLSTPCVLLSQYPLRSPAVHYYSRPLPYPVMPVYALLHEAGYRTAIVSSQDERWGGMTYLWESPGLDHLAHPGTADPSTHRILTGDGVTGRLKGVFDDARTVDEGLRWIEADASRPFFLYLNLQNVHLPYEVPAGFPRRFSKDSGSRSPDVYADCASYVDAQLRRLTERLRELGLWDRTVFVLTADHGESFPGLGGWGHAGRIHDEVMRVPLVFRVPGRPPLLDRRPSQGIDVPPSILSVLGLPAHASFQGIDLFTPEPPAARSRYLLSQSMMAHQYGIVRGSYKLVFDGNLGWLQLYDLAKDPRETQDLANERPDLVEELSGRFGAWWAAQLSYYGDAERRRTEYAPSLRE